MPLSQKKITIVLPVHNRKKEILHCLHQLENIDKNDMEISIVVVDDGSTDGTSDAIKLEYPDVTVLSGNGNLWWTGATKLGAEYSISKGCDYVLTMNDDVEFSSNFLAEMFNVSKVYRNSIICAVICDKDDRTLIISAGRYAKGFLGYDYGGYLAGEKISKLPKKEYESDVESGYAMLIPRRTFNYVEFDDIAFPHHMGDMDFVLRARKKGYKIIISPRSFLYTKTGENYFHIQIINKSFWQNLQMFFNIKSTVNFRTRLFFYWRHTPYYLGWISFIYFMTRMLMALIMKLLLPSDVLFKIMKKRMRDPQPKDR